MLGEFKASNMRDVDGNPSGGRVDGVGLRITWQTGPLGRGADRKAPNGAFVETVIAAAKQRIEFYQESKFKCAENEKALWHLDAALKILNSRTQRREAQGTEGTHAEDPAGTPAGTQLGDAVPGSSPAS